MTAIEAPDKLRDIRQLGNSAEEIMAALEDPEVFDAIFGEPSDEEFAEAARQAEAEYAAGDYQARPLDTGDDDKPYLTPTRQEILDGFKQSYKAALAGDVLSEEEFLARLRD